MSLFIVAFCYRENALQSTVLACLLDTIINKQKVLVDKLMGTKDVVYFSANPGKNLSCFQMRVLRNESGRHKKTVG
ncbi:MAG: hypothetical protein ACR65O_04765 [Methylomicrobium sp.]